MKFTQVPAHVQEIARNYVEPLQVEGNAVQLKRLRPRHQAIMDYLLASPTTKYSAVAEYFHVTPAWLSSVINSDLFQAQLNRRRAMMDDQTHRGITEQLTELATSSLAHLQIAIEDSEVDPSLKHNIAKTALEAAGFLGKSAASAPSIQINTTLTQAVDSSAISAHRALMLESAAERVSAQQTQQAADLGLALEHKK